MYFVKVLSKKLLQPTGSSDNSLFRLTMAYDGSGRRISKTRWVKKLGSQEWEKELVTHYTGIGTEIRENYAGPAKETKVVVNMPQGLGRYGIEDAENPDMGSGAGYIPNAKFEWYLKNHLGSTMLVYGTQADANPMHSDIGTPLAAYDYRAFGEMVELTPPPTGKITENFTGKEHDDEIALDYFGARYLDPMLGMWISMDSKRQFASPYLYAGNGYNPVNAIDPDGNIDVSTILVGAVIATTVFVAWDCFLNVNEGANLLNNVDPSNPTSNGNQNAFYQIVGVNALKAVAGLLSFGAGGASSGAPTLSKGIECIRSLPSRASEFITENAGVINDLKDGMSDSWDYLKEKVPSLIENAKDGIMDFFSSDKTPATQEE